MLSRVDKVELDVVISYLNKNECGVTSSLVLINKIVKDTDETLRIMNERVNWYTENS